MTVYRYQAVDASGKTVKGVLDAGSKGEAKQQLESKDYIVYELDERNLRTNKSNLSLSAEQKTLLTRQLATLLGAGVTLEKSLKSCSRQSHNKKTKALATQMYNKVVEGMPFSQVLSEYPNVFDPTFCATISAGEQSGHLATILGRLADHSESSQMMRASIKQAMIYPIILFVVASMMIVYLMTAVIPDVVKVFTASGQDLPSLTKVLLSISHFISQYGIYILGSLFIFYWIITKLSKRPKFVYKKHQLMLSAPIISNITKTYHASHYSSTLSVLLNSGVKLVDALQISAQTISNRVIQSVANHASHEVQKGKSLAQSLMTEKQVFPGMLVELINTGEQTATLATMLDKASEIFQRQSQSRLATLTNLLGPLMILFMGGLIFVIVLAILLPIFDLNQAIK